MEKMPSEIVAKLLELVGEVSTIDVPEFGNFPKIVIALNTIAFRFAIIGKTIHRLTPIAGTAIFLELNLFIRNKKMDEKFDPNRVFPRVPNGPAASISMELDRYDSIGISSGNENFDRYKLIKDFVAGYGEADLYAIQGPDTPQASARLTAFAENEYKSFSSKITGEWDHYLNTGRAS